MPRDIILHKLQGLYNTIKVIEKQESWNIRKWEKIIYKKFPFENLKKFKNSQLG